MATLTIAPTEGLSLRAAASIFVAAFGGIWLMIEPLSYFGILPHPSKLGGVSAYAGMVVFSILAVLLSARIHRWLALSKLKFLIFTIVSASEGTEYSIRAPEHMQVWDLIERFLEHLRTGPAANRIEWLNRHFEPVLQLESNGDFLDLDGGLTLQQAGISNGMRCQIRGKPREPRILFSRGPARNDTS